MEGSLIAIIVVAAVLGGALLVLLYVIYSFTKSENQKSQYIINRLFGRIMHRREKNSPEKHVEGPREVSTKIEVSYEKHDECVRCACGNSKNTSKSFTNASYCKSEDEEVMITASIRLNLPPSPIRTSAATYSIVDLNTDG